MSTELAERPASPFTTLTATDIMNQVRLIQEVMESVMEDGHHYGTIPGTPKPTLLKPGAEKLGLTFRLRPEYDILPQSLLTDRVRTYRLKCRLVHIKTNESWGEGVGSCSSNEKKYAKQIQKGTPLDDLDNTIFKMAAKRAHVAAILSATAASDIFTQDLDETDAAPVPTTERKAPASPPPVPPSGAPFLTFGKHKGKALDDPAVDTGYLEWLEDSLTEQLADPGKQQYAERNQALKQAVFEELNRRAAEATPA